jgi:hypothetical protein
MTNCSDTEHSRSINFPLNPQVFFPTRRDQLHLVRVGPVQTAPPAPRLEGTVQRDPDAFGDRLGDGAGSALGIEGAAFHAGENRDRTLSAPDGLLSASCITWVMRVTRPAPGLFNLGL